LEITSSQELCVGVRERERERKYEREKERDKERDHERERERERYIHKQSGGDMVVLDWQVAFGIFLDLFESRVFIEN